MYTNEFLFFLIVFKYFNAKFTLHYFKFSTYFLHKYYLDYNLINQKLEDDF